MTAPTPKRHDPAGDQDVAERGRPWRERLGDDRTAGAGMVLASVAALAWANWPGSSYQPFWNTPGSLLGLSLRGWVDQGLLFVFFAQVGLEIRREVRAGELRSLRRGAIPVVAALVGMAVPALLYTMVVAGGPGAGGWGIPTATDVAFAVAALSVLGNFPGRARARVFLLTLAVADDLATIVILVAVYSHNVRFAWMAVGLAATAGMAVLWWRRVPVLAARVGLAALSWYSMVRAGVEASVVGAALGAWGPYRRDVDSTPNPPVRVLLNRLGPVVNVAVLPVFALANIGVALNGSVFSDSAARTLFVAVTAARVLGKPAGILAGTALARRATASPDSPRVTTRVLGATGAVAGIGFTVPLLIISAALPVGPQATAATAGLLAGTVLSVAASAATLRLRLRPPWLAAVAFVVVVAGVDAALGPGVVIAGLIALGPPAAAVISGRVGPTAVVAVLAVAAAAAVGLPDGTWSGGGAALWTIVTAVTGAVSLAAAARRARRTARASG